MLGRRLFAICLRAFPNRPTRRQSQRPWLSRLVLRAARAAPATVVAHLERWAKNHETRYFHHPICGHRKVHQPRMDDECDHLTALLWRGEEVFYPGGVV